MTLAEFEEHLLRFGSDLEAWPPFLANDARDLLAKDPGATRMLGEFISFDETVSQAVQAPPFGSASIGHVLSALDRDEEAWRPARRFWIAAATASMLAFFAGVGATVVGLHHDDAAALPVALLGIAAGQGNIGGLL
jgi:hypothetical protein